MEYCSKAVTLTINGYTACFTRLCQLHMTLSFVYMAQKKVVAIIDVTVSKWTGGISKCIAL